MIKFQMKIIFFLAISAIIFSGALPALGFVGDPLRPAPLGVEPNVSGNVNFEAGEASDGNLNGKLSEGDLQTNTGKNPGKRSGFKAKNIFWLIIGFMIFILLLVRIAGQRRKKDIF